MRYFAGSAARSTWAAVVQLTSCSADWPPNSTMRWMRSRVTGHRGDANPPLRTVTIRPYVGAPVAATVAAGAVKLGRCRHPSDPRFRTQHALRIKGFAKAEVLGEIADLPASDVEGHLAELAADGSGMFREAGACGS